MESLIFIVSTLAPTAFLVGIAWVLPGWSAPGLFFGVSVEKAHPGTPEGRRAVGRYRAILLGFGLLALAVELVLHGFVLRELGILIALFGFFLAYLRAHKLTRPHAIPEPPRVASLGERPRLAPLAWAQLLPFGILAGVSLALWHAWPSLPASLYTGAHGPSGLILVTKTPLSVFGTPLMGALCCGFLFSLAAGWITRGRRLANDRFGASSLMAWILIASEILMALGTGGAGLTPLMSDPTGWTAAVTACFMVLVLGFLVGLMTVLVVRSHRAPPVAAAGDNSPDRGWKLGLLYVNRADPALFVPKRFGVGFTINFGHPAGPWVLVLPLAIIGVVSWLVAAAGHGAF
jgi:uncharacterized membrane protein